MRKTVGTTYDFPENQIMSLEKCLKYPALGIVVNDVKSEILFEPHLQICAMDCKLSSLCCK